MPRYVVELYASGATPPAALARSAQSAARAEIRYLRSIFLPEDETCLHVFEATSPSALRSAAEQAGIAVARIVEALCLEPGDGASASTPGVSRTS